MVTIGVPKILITGSPGSGKTTLVCEVARNLVSVRGFYTREIRERGRRVGFSLSVLGGKELTLAHVGIRSRHRVGKYGVDVKSFETAVCPEINSALCEDSIIVIDEIGKMELFSQKFRQTVLRALDSSLPVLATIYRGTNPFTDSVKARPDVKLIELAKANRDELAKVLLRRLEPFDISNAERIRLL
jgi:nucleoside-triphosphatase THEP1